MFCCTNQAWRGAVAGFVALVSLYSLSAAQSLGAADTPPLTTAQLDRLVAPIALYPDSLIAQILMAATYPLEVVEADRWLRLPANAALKGDALTAALQQQPWDPSIKSLVAFPQVVHTMDTNLNWTEQLGDAFLAQQPDVMDAVQRLRLRAQAAGSLASTPQQAVSTENQEIMIEPVSPDIVYLPTYNPWCVYGAWPLQTTHLFCLRPLPKIAYLEGSSLPSGPVSRRSVSGHGDILIGIITPFGSTMIASNNSAPAASRRGKSGSTIAPIAMVYHIAIRPQQRGSSARAARRCAATADSHR